MRALIPLLTALALASTAHAAADQSYAEHLPATASGTVQISNVSGSVTVTAWDKAEVDIKGELGPNVERVDVTHTEDHIVIKVVLPQNLHFDADRGTDAKLQVRVPAASTLEVSTVSAPITVDGLKGASRLRTVSGDIHADAPGAREELASVSGNVFLGANSSVKTTKVSTVSGSVVLTHGNGDVNARTINGKLDLTVDSATSVEFGSISGSVDFHGHLARDASLRGSTVEGTLSVKVSADDGYKYEVATFGGSLHSCFATQPAVQSPSSGPHGRLNGTTGAGNATVKLTSMRGSIDLCDR